MTKVIDNLTKYIKTRKAVFGSKETIRLIKNNAIEIVYLSNDCPDDIAEKLQSKNKISIIRLEMSKEELKELCKKPFNTSVISILKEKTEENSKPKDKKEK